jgi:aminopeptidase N
MLALDQQGAKLTQDFPDYNFRVYTFDKPMAPGERREIHFETEREQRGFRNSGNDDRLVANGTFLDNWLITPWLGVPRYPFLKDRATRHKYGLDPDLRLSTLEDGKGRAFNYFRHDSDHVNSDITLSGPADQTLLAAGQQVSRQIIGNRQIVRFKSEAPILNFFSIQAGKYAVAKDRWSDIGIEIYYHPQHAYNVERMISIIKDSLRYYTAEFSPYQFHQFRIVEFPAYNNFAQSFPGTVPYSEAAGFVLRIDDKQGIDFITYGTAHEFGHQWWAHQVIGGDQEGSTVLTETLAQYSAIMVMENRYGPAMIRRFLKHGLDNYLTDRGKENVAEPPLERVQEQAYVRYDKGGLVMYLLKDRLGEEKVNRALRSLIQQFAFKGAPYPTSRDLESALRAEAQPDQQQLITDLFQHITLYDLKVTHAQTSPLPDGKWRLSMTVEAHKRYADGKGEEKEAPLDEMIDIGAFTADPNEAAFSQEDVISLAAQRITTGANEVSIVLDKRPLVAGIDPYLKYIDRNWSDNVRTID